MKGEDSMFPVLCTAPDSGNGGNHRQNSVRPTRDSGVYCLIMNCLLPVSSYIYEYSCQFSSRDGEVCLIFLEKGEITVRSPIETCRFSAPVGILLPPYPISTVSGNGRTLLLILDPSALSRLLNNPLAGNLYRKLKTVLENRDYRASRLNEEGLREWKRLFININGEIKKENREAKRLIQLYLLEILNSLAGSLPYNRDETKLSKPGFTIQEILPYINEHYSESFSLAELASRCGMNPTYFSRIFREETGTPLFEYINRLRINRACGLMKTSGLSILEIAYAVGYNNISFFNRYFRKIHNKSPGQYRKKIRQ